MKTIQNTLKLAMIAIVLVFVSCSKDDSPSEDSDTMQELTNHELLMSGKWYIHATSDSGSTNDCQRQSYFQFIDEDTLVVQYFYTDGGDNCTPNPLNTALYQMNEDGTIILPEYDNFYFVIDFISESELLLRQTDGITSVIYTMKK